MSARSLIMSAAGNAGDKLYVDDVFSAYTYTGTGATQTINNGIDLAGKGGLVWLKSRSTTLTHGLVDTFVGVNQYLSSSSTAASTVASSVTGFTSTGFSAGSGFNVNGTSCTSWTFRIAPKFFDILTWTGDNVSIGRTLPHALAAAPGMILVKATSTAGGWYTWHRGSTTGNYLKLNTTDAQSTLLANTYFGNGTTTVDPTSSNLTVGLGLNMVGVSYVAYLFAHDASADGIVQCGGFTTDGSGNATVNLGWEPQYVLMKRASGGTSSWYLLDTARGLPVGSSDNYLFADQSMAEGSLDVLALAATGFSALNAGASMTWTYMAIRRSNKPPTLGTQVYNAIARTGTGAAATVTGVGFAPDLVMSKVRNGGTHGAAFDRLRGALPRLYPSAAASESSAYSDQVTSFGQDGMSVGPDASALSVNAITPYIYHFFKRAQGVFDVCCYTGTGVAKTEAHGLGVVPELIIVKSRSAATEGEVYLSSLGNDKSLNLFFSGGGAAFTTSGLAWNYTTPTATAFSLGTWAKVNGASVTFVAYLFATKAGISKVGSYTGNGTSQTINCGFTTGSRFILIKRTDSTGDWFVYDTVRGIVAGNDPHLSLNTFVAEVTTDDSIDPDASGFIVNQVAATNLNVSAATYIYLAFA